MPQSKGTEFVKMGLDETDPTARESSVESNSRSRSRSRRRKSKNSFTPLASEDSLWNSNSSCCNFSEPEDDDDNNWSFRVGFKEVPKNGSASNHSGRPSLASTNGSSSTNNSNSKRSPRRTHKSPKRSPRPSCLSTSKDENSAHQGRQMPTVPFSSEDDRVQSKHERRHSGGNIGKSKDGPPKDGKGLYYQPSKAALGLNNPTKKPQRVRSRSNTKGPVLRGRKDQQPSSKHNGESVSSSTGASRESGKKSNSSEPIGKKPSPPSSRTRKKPSCPKNATPSKGLSRSLHDHRPKSRLQDDKELERQKQVQGQMQKIKRKKPTIVKTKSVLGQKDNGLDEVISFFEEIAAKKANGGHSPPPKNHLGRSMKKSMSFKGVSRSRSPASSSVASAQSTPEPDLMTKGRRQRRSSAPAKALAAFNQYRKSILTAAELEDDDNEDDEPSTQTPPPPPEKIMLDVSELAALEIIRLGPDNSLKLDVFDLMKHLRRQQLQK